MERIEKAHRALADSIEAWDGSPDAPHERVLVLLRIAEVQAHISQAESLAKLAHDQQQKQSQRHIATGPDHSR